MKTVTYNEDTLHNFITFCTELLNLNYNEVYTLVAKTYGECLADNKVMDLNLAELEEDILPNSYYRKHHEETFLKIKELLVAFMKHHKVEDMRLMYEINLWGIGLMA